jgi:hypothetical protein
MAQLREFAHPVREPGSTASGPAAARVRADPEELAASPSRLSGYQKPHPEIISRRGFVLSDGPG